MLITEAIFAGANEDEEEDESEEDDETDEAVATGSPGERNSQLTVGHKHDRTFVVRGDKIGVFKHTDEGKVEYAATIKDLGFKKMKSFKPRKVRLSQYDLRSIPDDYPDDAPRSRREDDSTKSRATTFSFFYGY